MQCVILIVLAIVVSLIILSQLIGKNRDGFKQKVRQLGGQPDQGQQHNCDKTQALQNISQRIDELLRELENCKQNGQNADDLAKQLQLLQQQFQQLQNQHGALSNQYNLLNADYNKAKICLQQAEQRIDEISAKLKLQALPTSQPGNNYQPYSYTPTGVPTPGAQQYTPTGIPQYAPTNISQNISPTMVNNITNVTPNNPNIPPYITPGSYVDPNITPGVNPNGPNNAPYVAPGSYVDPSITPNVNPNVNPSGPNNTNITPSVNPNVNPSVNPNVGPNVVPNVNPSGPNNTNVVPGPNIPNQNIIQPTDNPADDEPDDGLITGPGEPGSDNGGDNGNGGNSNNGVTQPDRIKGDVNKSDVNVIEPGLIKTRGHADQPTIEQQPPNTETPQQQDQDTDEKWKRDMLQQLIDNPSQDPSLNMESLMDAIDVPADVIDGGAQKKTNKNNRVGGAGDEKEITQQQKERILQRFQEFLEHQYYKPLKLLNTGTMLYMISLTSYGRIDKLFQKIFAGQSKAALRSFITSVFIPLSPAKVELITELTKDGDRIPCIQDEWYKRDMAILKRYYPEIQQQYPKDSIQVMIHQLFNQIYSIIKSGEKVLSLLNNTNHKTALLDLMVDLQARIDNMFHIYKQSTKTYETVYQEFAQLQLEQQRIFTYVKIRQDDSSGVFEGGNPRYDVKWLPVSEQSGNARRNILVRYINTDESFADNNAARAKIKEWQTPKSSSDGKGAKIDEMLEEYIFGPVDGAFQAKDTAQYMAGVWQQQLSEKLVQRRQSVCIFGYGQSGAGKTSTLVYLGYTNKQGQFVQEDGIVVHLCNALGKTKNANDPNRAVRIEVSMVNFYVNQNADIGSMEQVVPSNGYATKDFEVDIKFTKAGQSAPQVVSRKNIVFGLNGTLGWQPVVNKDKLKILDDQKVNPQNQQQVVFTSDDFANQSLGFVINEGFSKREVEPTPNNPDSSRSHMIVFIDIVFAGANSNPLSQGKTKSQLIICDLAGVENKFQCSVMGEIFKFDEKYTVSGKYKSRSQDIPSDRNLCNSRHYMAKMSEQEINVGASKYNPKIEKIKGWDFGSDNLTYEKLGVANKALIDSFNGMSRSAKIMSEFVNDFANYYSTNVPGYIFALEGSKIGGREQPAKQVSKGAKAESTTQAQKITSEINMKSLQYSTINTVGADVSEEIMEKEKLEHLGCDPINYNFTNCSKKDVKIDQNLYDLLFNCQDGVRQTPAGSVQRQQRPTISDKKAEPISLQRKITYVFNKHGFSNVKNVYAPANGAIPQHSPENFDNRKNVDDMVNAFRNCCTKGTDANLLQSMGEELYYLTHPSIDSMKYLIAKRVQESVCSVIMLRYLAFCCKFDEDHFAGNPKPPTKAPAVYTYKYLQIALARYLTSSNPFTGMIQDTAIKRSKYMKLSSYLTPLGSLDSNATLSKDKQAEFILFRPEDYVSTMDLVDCSALTDGMTQITNQTSKEDRAQLLKNRFVQMLKARCEKIITISNASDDNFKAVISNLLGFAPAKGLSRITDLAHLDEKTYQVNDTKLAIQEVIDNLSYWTCLYFRIGKLQHNCELRLKEGYMINRALADLTGDLANIVKACLATDATMEDGTKALPLILAPNTMPYNVNVYWQHDKYAEMYQPFTSDASGKLLGLLQERLQLIGSNLTDLNFVVFTVINLTNNGEKNNPPNPPFINTNTAKYYIETESAQSENANAAVQKLVAQLLTFKFYQEYKVNVGTATPLGNLLNDTYINSAYFEGAIEIIDKVNDSTLLGTLQATEKIRNIPYDKYIESYDKDIEAPEFLSHYSRQRDPAKQEAILHQVGRRDISIQQLIEKHKQNDKYLGNPTTVSDILKI